MLGWLKISQNRWRNANGVEIIKYRMAGKFYYLRYEGGYKDYSDYKTFKSLKEAKT